MYLMEATIMKNLYIMLIVAMLALVGCEQQTDDLAEDVGENIDEAVDNIQEATEDAWDATSDMMEEATDETEKAADELN
jgi:gas vesicle protein